MALKGAMCERMPTSEQFRVCCGQESKKQTAMICKRTFSPIQSNDEGSFGKFEKR